VERYFILLQGPIAFCMFFLVFIEYTVQLNKKSTLCIFKYLIIFKKKANSTNLTIFNNKFILYISYFDIST